MRPYPPPGDLPDPGIEHMSFMSPTLAGRFFTTSASWKASLQGTSCKMPGFLNHKLESVLPEKISTTSDMQMISL